MTHCRLLVLTEQQERHAGRLGCLDDVAELRYQYDGAQGLADVGIWQPDIVFTDRSLQGLGGIEVVRRLRGHPETEHLPAALLLWDGRGDGLAEAAEAGVDMAIADSDDSSRLHIAVEVLRGLGRRRKEAARHRNERTDRLRHALVEAGRFSLLGRLIASVASELTGHLADIESFSDVARSVDPPQVRRTLDKQLKVVADGRELVDRLIDYARIQHPHLSLFDPADCIERVRRILQRRIGSQGYRLEVNLPSDLVLWGDEGLFCQSALRLIELICRSAPPRTVIHIGGRYDGDMAVIETRSDRPSAPADPAGRAWAQTELDVLDCLAERMSGRFETTTSPEAATVYRLRLPFRQG